MWQRGGRAGQPKEHPQAECAWGCESGLCICLLVNVCYAFTAFFRRAMRRQKAARTASSTRIVPVA